MMARLTQSCAALALFAGLHSLVGCANDGGAKSLTLAGSKDQNLAPLVVVADTANNRIVTIRDLTAAGWQSYGPSGKYDQPTALAIDASERIYALDTQGTRVTRIDSIGGGNWTTFGAAGAGTNQFQGASALAVFPPAPGSTLTRLLIADTGNARLVAIDDLSGKNWTTFSGSGTHVLHAPGAVAVDASSRIYVADGDHVVRIDSLDGSGWTSFGSAGSGNGQFAAISAIALDASGKIFIADRGNGRIVRIDDLSGAGWVSYSGVSSPAAMTADTQGHVTIADPANNRVVQISDMSGTSQSALGTAGTGVGSFASPSGIALIFNTAAIL